MDSIISDLLIKKETNYFCAIQDNDNHKNGMPFYVFHDLGLKLTILYNNCLANGRHKIVVQRLNKIENKRHQSYRLQIESIFSFIKHSKFVYI